MVKKSQPKRLPRRFDRPRGATERNCLSGSELRRTRKRRRRGRIGLRDCLFETRTGHPKMLEQQQTDAYTAPIR
eukprot:7811850-Pyramimonas_sp.AAC.1